MTRIPPRTDHQNAARYADVANRLRIGRDFWDDQARSLTADTDSFDTFAVPLLNRIRPLLEEIAGVYADLADGDHGAQELAGTYRALVEGRFGATG